MKFVAALCALTVFCVPTAQAGSKRPLPPKPPTEKALPYATTALDPSIENLGPNYLGQDCRVLAKKVSALNPQKGEFETSAAYSDRQITLNNTTINGSVMLGDLIGFVPASSVLSMLTQQYDADRGVLELRTYISDSRQSINHNVLSSKKLEYKLKQESSYAASNSYGKTVQVKSTIWDTCGVAFANQAYLDSSSNTLKTSVSLPAEEARDAKGKIAIMYVGSLSSPYWIEFHDYLKPTIDSPMEAGWTGDALVMKLMQIWFFNKDTGKVYKKVDI